MRNRLFQITSMFNAFAILAINHSTRQDLECNVFVQLAFLQLIMPAKIFAVHPQMQSN